MNGVKKIFTFLFTVVMLGSITACSQNDTTPKEYTSANGKYAITLPSNWIQDTGVRNEDMLVVYSDEEQTMSISIQRYDKEIAKDTMGLDSLERFQTYYQTNSFMAGLYTLGTATQQQYTMTNMIAVAADELISDADADTVLKAFNVVAESQKSYYTCTITGEQQYYDKEITSLKESLSALKEKE